MHAGWLTIAQTDESPSSEALRLRVRLFVGGGLYDPLEVVNMTAQVLRQSRLQDEAVGKTQKQG